MTSRFGRLCNTNWLFVVCYCAAALVLTGCGEKAKDSLGPVANSSATASSGSSSSSSTSSVATSPTNASQVTTAPVSTKDSAPTISGTPSLEVTAGSSFAFAPVATDADGDTLAFQIVNKPNWATFNTATGQLIGSPTSADVGTYSNIGISVTDGTTVTSLPAFALTVAQVATGSVTLSWTPPTSNTDGTSLSNLAGYKIHYGSNADALTETIAIPNAGMSMYVIENLSPATWYFAIKAYTTAGVESGFSAVASKKI